MTTTTCLSNQPVPRASRCGAFYLLMSQQPRPLHTQVVLRDRRFPKDQRGVLIGIVGFPDYYEVRLGSDPYNTKQPTYKVSPSKLDTV